MSTEDGKMGRRLTFLASKQANPRSADMEVLGTNGARPAWDGRELVGGGGGDILYAHAHTHTRTRSQSVT